MTGIQESSSENGITLPAPLAGDLSSEWSDSDVLRAVVRALSPARRREVLAEVRAELGICTNDTVNVAFNA
jgi:hypothetical protein